MAAIWSVNPEVVKTRGALPRLRGRGKQRDIATRRPSRAAPYRMPTETGPRFRDDLHTRLGYRCNPKIQTPGSIQQFKARESYTPVHPGLASEAALQVFAYRCYATSIHAANRGSSDGEAVSPDTACRFRSLRNPVDN
jgi:hypothetical protein